MEPHRGPVHGGSYHLAVFNCHGTRHGRHRQRPTTTKLPFTPGPSPVSNPLDVIATTNAAPAEAPTGFDDQPNGMVDSATHGMDAAVFSEVEDAAGGLGPLFNAQSCRECHQTPAVGGVSQVTELRVGYVDTHGNFTNPNISDR